jgi:hypothetical protein
LKQVKPYLLLQSIVLEKKRYTVYGRKNDFIDPLFETDKSRELIIWFNERWSENV